MLLSCVAHLVQEVQLLFADVTTREAGEEAPATGEVPGHEVDRLHPLDSACRRTLTIMLAEEY